MTLNQVVNIINIFQIGLLIKLFIAVAAIFYLALTVIIYRQIVLMTQILNTEISPLVKTIAMVQIVVAGVLVLLAVVLA